MTSHPELHLWVDDQIQSPDDRMHAGQVLNYQPLHMISAHDETEVTSIAVAADLQPTVSVSWSPEIQELIAQMISAHVPNVDKLVQPTQFFWRHMHGKEVVFGAGVIYSARALADMGPGVVAHFDTALKGWILGL